MKKELRRSYVVIVLLAIEEIRVELFGVIEGFTDEIKFELLNVLCVIEEGIDEIRVELLGVLGVVDGVGNEM